MPEDNDGVKMTERERLDALQKLLAEAGPRVSSLMRPGDVINLEFKIIPKVILPGQRPAVYKLLIMRPAASMQLTGSVR